MLSGKTVLEMPRCYDCIAMLLGSVKEYKAQFSKTRKETSRLGLKFDEVQADGKFLMKMLKRDWDRVFWC